MEKIIKAYREYTEMSGYFVHPAHFAAFLAGIAYAQENQTALREIAQAVKGIEKEIANGAKYGD